MYSVGVYTELLATRRAIDSPLSLLGGPSSGPPVRTGLVILGSVIAILGGGLIITLFYFSGGPTTTSQLSFENPGVAPHAVLPEVFARSTSTQASIGLSWSTSAPANVSLTPVGPCSTNALGLCPIGPPLFNWTLSLSGKGTASSTNASAYLLQLTNPGNSSIRFSAVVSVSYHPGAPLPAWGWGLIALGGVTLLGIGGIAVFLGLFLPGGVYRDPPAMELRPPPGIPPEEPPP